MELILVAILAILAGLTIGYTAGMKRSHVEAERIERKIKEEAREEARKILEKAKNLGADIVKVAFTAKDLESAQRLCCAVSVFKHPKVFMAMGSAGMFTRVVGFSFGSLLTYTFFGKPTAPGQVPAEKLVKLLHGLYPDYHARKAGCFVG